MINRIKKTASALVLLFVTTAAFAQENVTTLVNDPTTEPPVDMATGLYQSGKIYVVVGVLAIIFIGIITYLIMLDRKIGKIEKEMKNK